MVTFKLWFDYCFAHSLHSLSCKADIANLYTSSPDFLFCTVITTATRGCHLTRNKKWKEDQVDLDVFYFFCSAWRISMKGLLFFFLRFNFPSHAPFRKRHTVNSTWNVSSNMDTFPPQWCARVMNGIKGERRQMRGAQQPAQVQKGMLVTMTFMHKKYIYIFFV